MTLIPFSPSPGLNSDDTTFAAEGSWADVNNVRFVNDKPQVIGGQESLFTIAAANGTCTSILPFNRSGAITIGYGLAIGASKLYVGTGLAAPSDRTPAGAPATDNWSLAPWGATLLACPQGGTLYEQSGSGAATEVTQAPNAITYMLTTPERQVLALGCSEESGGTFNGLCVRGCDLEDYTDWTTASTGNAFEHILDGSGAIVSGRMVGSYVAVWTTNALHIGQFIGDPGQAYRFDRVDENCGLVGPNAVIVVGQTAYWVGTDLRVKMWSPGTPVQVLPCPVSKQFRDMALSNAKYVVASANARFNEIRFDQRSTTNPAYPAGNTNNRYYSVSLQDGAWYAGAGGRTAIVDDSALSTLTAGYTGGPTVLACMYDGTNNTFYLHDSGTFAWGTGTAALPAPYVQSADQYLDNSQRRLMIRSCIPDFEDQSASVMLTLFVRGRPQSSAATKGPFTLTTATTKKDFRASGKLVAVKFGGDATSSGSLYFRLGKPLFDAVPTGER